MFRKLAAAIVFAAATAVVAGPALATQKPAQMPAAPTASGDIKAAQYGGGGGHKYSDAHYRWCESRYKSYRRASNTYMTYGGEWRQCHSPYM